MRVTSVSLNPLPIPAWSVNIPQTCAGDPIVWRQRNLREVVMNDAGQPASVRMTTISVAMLLFAVSAVPAQTTDPAARTSRPAAPAAAAAHTAAVLVPDTARELLVATHRQVFGRHRVVVATGLKGIAACSDPVALAPLEMLLPATLAGRDADVMRLLGTLQARLMCLTPDGARTYDLFFATLLSRGLALPDGERALLFAAYFNAALLAFDQVQYTGRSLVQVVLTTQGLGVRAALAGYPASRLGLFALGPRSGALVQLPGANCAGQSCQSIVVRVLDMFADPRRLGDGGCPLVTLAMSDFQCRRQIDCGEKAHRPDMVVGPVVDRIAELTAQPPRLDDLESIAWLGRATYLVFGAPYDQARQLLCGQPGAPHQPPLAESGNLMSCLIAARDAAQGLQCETQGPSPQWLELGAVGTAVWDRRCVGMALADGASGDCVEGADGDGATICATKPRRSGGESRPAGNEPAKASKNTEQDREALSNTFLATTKRDLERQPLRGNVEQAIAQQCGTYGKCGANPNDRRRNVSAAIDKALEVTHYAPGEPKGDRNAPGASTCVRPGGCAGDMNYGDIRISERTLHHAPDDEIHRQLMHEILHHVYSQLGFDGQSGPQVDREGRPVHGGDHHRLIDQIVVRSSIPFNPRTRRIYNPPQVRDPVDPDDYPGCSAAAERARAQVACWEDRADRARGAAPATLYERRFDPRTVNPIDVAGAPPACTALDGTVLPRPPAACGLMLCAGTGACRCSAGVVPVSIDGDRVYINPRSVDCQPGEVFNPATGQCEGFGR
jgi:hypothetical protein